MYCPNCKQEYDGKFCPECGTKLIEKPTNAGGINFNLGDANPISGGVHISNVVHERQRPTQKRKSRLNLAAVLSAHKEQEEDILQLHQRWDDKLSPDIVELFGKNADLFEDEYDPDRLERKILRYIQIYKEDMDLYDFDEWNDRLEQLAKDGLSGSQMTIIHNIAKEVDRYLTKDTV